MGNLNNICEQILDFFDKHDNFLITAHLSADGDAYGAALSIAFYLNFLSKKYEVVFHDQEKETKYDYLWGFDEIRSYNKNMTQEYDAAVIVDVPSKSRIGDSANLLPIPEYCLKIDHHPVEEHLSEISLVDTSASSTCQLVYEILSRSNIVFEKELATLLLSGIMYDTGRFSFSNTSQRDFEIAANLTGAGASSNQIASHLFFNNSFESLKMVGYGLANMQLRLNGKVCVISLPLELMQSSKRIDTDELSNYSLAIKGVEVGLFVRQFDENITKVSFRSRGLVDVNKVARNFGGGGHLHAAGCRTNAEPDGLIENILIEIQKQLA